MRNKIRILITAFMIALMLAVIAGIRWWGQDGPKPPPNDARPILILGLAAGLAGLWVIWSDRSSRHRAG